MIAEVYYIKTVIPPSSGDTTRVERQNIQPKKGDQGVLKEITMLEMLTGKRGRNLSLPTTMADVPTSRTAAVFRWLGQVVPTLLVLAALGGLASWGHHTGWTIP